MPRLPEQVPVITGMRRYFGIDPGASGGLAMVYRDNLDSVVKPMPETEKDIWTWFESVVPPVRDWDATCFAVIEKVSGYIGKAHPGSAMFKFGQSYGGLRMALVGLGIPFEEVTAQRWQKSLGISVRGKKESKGQFKNRLKARAQQLFPAEKVTLATADALLIAEYCRRFREGRLQDAKDS